MKRYLIYVLFAATSFLSCKKDGLTRFEVENSFQDPNMKFDDFKKMMAGGTEGFRMLIQSASGSFYGGYIKLDGSSNAKFVLDNSMVNAVTPQDTKYNISLNQTNSVIGLSSTSAFAVFANAAGGVDTSYSYRSVSGDTIKLVGNVKGARLSLIKATKADADGYLAGEMGKAITDFSTLNNFKHYFKRFIISTKTYDIVLNTKLRYITINSSDGTAFRRFTSKYAYINNGIAFNTPFVDGAVKIVSLTGLVTNLTINAATGTAGESAFRLENAMAPLAYDPTAAASFYKGGTTVISNTGGGLSWISYTGFTINGIKDALGSATITGLNYLSFTPRYRPDYDRLGFVSGSAIQAYGPAVSTTVKANGTITFSYFGNFGNPAAAYVNVVNNTRLQFTDPQGYYVVQSGPNQYDLVNVKDATAWISFE